MNFIIPITPVTKKNHQRIVMIGGAPRVIPSKQYKDYERMCAPFMPQVSEPINQPVNVKCLYYMPTRRKCDLVNLQQSTLDILVKYGIIVDDNYSVVASMDGSRVLYDKEHPRTEIYIRAVE